MFESKNLHAMIDEKNYGQREKVSEKAKLYTTAWFLKKQRVALLQHTFDLPYILCTAIYVFCFHTQLITVIVPKLIFGDNWGFLSKQAFI